MVIVVFVLVVLGLVAVATGVLGWLGRLPVNRFVGVHDERLVREPEAFRVANRVAAPLSLVAGGLLLAAGAVVLRTGPWVGGAMALMALTIAVGALGAGVRAGSKAAAALITEDVTAGCGGSCGACHRQCVD